MFPFNRYPWSNLHELNLDWVLEKVSALENISSSALANLEETIEKVNSFSAGLLKAQTDATNASVKANSLSSEVSSAKQAAAANADNINAILNTLQTLSEAVESNSDELQRISGDHRTSPYEFPLAFDQISASTEDGNTYDASNTSNAVLLELEKFFQAYGKLQISSTRDKDIPNTATPIWVYTMANTTILGSIFHMIDWMYESQNDILVIRFKDLKTGNLIECDRAPAESGTYPYQYAIAKTEA